MSGSFGKNFKVTVFYDARAGELGVIIDSPPPGFEIDSSNIRSRLDAMNFSTAGPLLSRRPYLGSCKVVSGANNWVSNGTPLCITAQNLPANIGAPDAEGILRPSSGDYSYMAKYGPHSKDSLLCDGDYFIMAGLTIAGAVARDILFKEESVIIGSHILSLGNVRDAAFDRSDITPLTLSRLSEMDMPFLQETAHDEAKDELARARSEGDSLGCVLECAAINVKAGIGSPIFDTVEGVLSHIVFSIPWVRGIDFGAGFSMAKMRGSSANDEFYFSGGSIKTRTNYAGGINAGITNAMPLVFRVAFRPPHLIKKEQPTVDMISIQETVFKNMGDSEVCALPMAGPAVEGAIAIALLDLFLNY